MVFNFDRRNESKAIYIDQLSCRFNMAENKTAVTPMGGKTNIKKVEFNDFVCV